jgi:hypothetical protein
VNVNILELLGIVFLVVIFINACIGMWAVKTAGFGGDNKSEAYSRN